MKKATKTIVNFILDTSGSMDSVRKSTISGFNEYIQTLQADTKSKYEFTLTLFNTTLSKPVVSQDIKDVKELTEETYMPHGGTALYDGVCSTLKDIKEEDDKKYIAIIMTDGEENASKEYTEKTMKAIIEDLEKKGNWTFVFLGANQDSYAKAQKFGFNPMNVSNFNTTDAGVGAVMRTMAANTMAYSASDSLSTKAFYSKADQDNLENTK